MTEKIRISVCMIVRNEEAILAQAISSTCGLADEVVILDTGSTDGTVALARSLGCTVLTGGDRMHKGKSRNLAAGAATGDWIVILDADETIAEPERLRAHIEQTDAQALFIRLIYMNAANRPTLSYAQMRCWRAGTFEYQYRAHEVPAPTNGWGKNDYTDFVWEHRPPPDRLWKSDYTRDRLLLDIEENPGNGRPLYYLGRQQMYRGDWQESIETLDRYLATDAQHDRADAYWCQSKCHKQLGDIQRQIKSLYLACAVQPGRREWWGTLGQIYHSKGSYALAVAVLKAALEIPLPTVAYATRYWYGSAIYDLMARCLWKLRRYHEGQEYAIRAVELAPGDERIRRNLLWFQSQLGDMDAFYQLHGPDIHSGCGRHQAIADLVEGPRVLDVGCGTGDLLLLLQAAHPEWVLAGTDISQVALEMAQGRGAVANLHNTDNVLGTHWDTIVMAQMLEHVESDAEMIEAARVALRPGGKLIVSVPNNGAIPSPDHRRDYTAESLCDLLSSIGSPVVHSWPGEAARILATVRL